MALLFVVGGLFAAADAVFEGFARDLFDVEDLSVHMTVIVLWAWIATPTILSHLDDVPKAERRFLVGRLEGEADDRRSWSLSRSRAQDALDDYARSVPAASR